jgi:hypothetical protein
MEFVVEDNEKPYLRPVDSVFYEQQMNVIDEVYLGKEINGRKIIEEYFKDTEVTIYNIFERIVKEKIDEIFPERLERKKIGKEDEQKIKFYFKKNELVFKITYYSGENKVENSDIEIYEEINNFTVQINAKKKLRLSDSQFLRFFIKKEFEKQAKNWLKREKEIKLRSLYK